MSDPTPRGPSRLLLACGGLIALAAVGAGGFAVIMLRSRAQIEPVATAFVAKVNAEDYAGAYAQIAPTWRRSQTEEELTRFLRLVRSVMGKCTARTTRSINVHSGTSGSSAEVVYAAVFERGPGTIRASFTQVEGRWQVLGWRVESARFAQLLTCPKCHRVSEDLVRFCPSCGAPMADPDGVAKTAASKTAAAKTAGAR